MARKAKHSSLPQVPGLFVPVLRGLIALGGSGNVKEINEAAYQALSLPEAALNIPHGPNLGGKSEIDYRLAWARTLLRKAGLIENSARGVWTLLKQDIDLAKIDSTALEKSLRNSSAKSNSSSEEAANIYSESVDQIEEVETPDWKAMLLEKLYTISPSAFERLSQRILRESGFIQVEVTGKTGDGGIDGKGIVRISGFLSFHVIFQCKRYRSSVTPSQIRDFRGAMQGRADKGLFITTSSFTRDAIKEATRDGAPPIDLIDGEFLCDKLRELKLGVSTEFIESVKVKPEWFDQL